jgi:hypothetical protein
MLSLIVSLLAPSRAAHIAVRAHQVRGGQFIDVGIADVVEGRR